MGQDINIGTGDVGNLSELQIKGGQGAELTSDEALTPPEVKNPELANRDTASAPEPERLNVIFPASSKDEQALNEGITNIGRVSIELPALDIQKSGFSLSKRAASALVTQFPQYKFMETKGDKNRQTITLE